MPDWCWWSTAFSLTGGGKGGSKGGGGGGGKGKGGGGKGEALGSGSMAGCRARALRARTVTSVDYFIMQALHRRDRPLRTKTISTLRVFKPSLQVEEPFRSTFEPRIILQRRVRFV